MAVVRSALQRRAASRAASLAAAPSSGLAASAASAHLRHQRFQPLGLVQVAAQPLVEGHARQVGHPLCQRTLAVFLPEEGGVAEAPHHHPLHVASDRRPRLSVGIGEGREAHDLALVQQRDVLLVVNEDGLQNLAGQVPELARHLAHHHCRMLDELLPFVHEAVVVFHLARGVKRRGDHLAPVARAEDHEGFAQLALEVGEAPHPNRLLRPAPRHEAMAQRGMAARDDRRPLRPRHELVDRERHYGTVEQDHHPADRPAEREGALAVVQPGVPAHPLGKGQGPQQSRQQARDHVGGGPARDLLDEQERFLVGLVRVFRSFAQLLGLDPVLLREALGGPRPLPRRIFRGLQGRTEDRFLAVGLAGLHVGAQDQAARGRERLDSGRIEQFPGAGFREAVVELRGEAREPGRRHLLEADLQQQLGPLSHAQPPPRPRDSSPRHRRPPLRRRASGCSGSFPPAGSPRSRREHPGR